MNSEVKERINQIESGVVPKGYKKTKLGIIPEEWKVRKLEELSERINVGFVGTCEKYYVDKENGIPMIRTGNIQNKKIDFTELKYVSNKFHEKNNKSHIKKDDLLLARHGSNGQTALYNYDFISNCLNIIIITPNNGVKPNYLYYQINSQNVNRLIMRKVGGSTQKVINLGDIKPLEIPSPSTKEQVKIADILSTWDKSIETLEKLIDEKEQQKKGLMQKLLTGKKRIEGFSGEWEEAKLGDIAKITMGQSPPSEGYNKDGIGLALIQGNADMKNGSTSPKVYTTHITKTCEVGDIIMSVRAPVGDLVLSQHKACIGRGVCSIRGNKYIYYYLIKNKNKLRKFSQGSTFEAINSSDIKNISVNLPPIPEQKAIAEILSTSDKEIELLKELLQNRKEQKKGLMQLLLTGIVRV